MAMGDSRFVILALFLLGCGAARLTPRAEPVPEPPGPVPSAPRVSDASAEEPHPTPPVAEETAPPTPPTPPAKAEPDPNATRAITYSVVPEGLKISVAGVRFSVRAAATQIAAGYGVKLNVVASAVDGKPHSLSSPKAGPLAFAGTVQRAGKSEAEPFADERAGDGEQEIFGDDPTKFSRSWPASFKRSRVLGVGDTLDLQVGLWGLGAEKDEQRPVKKFCHVRMKVEKGKPRAILEPPISASEK